MPKKSTSTVSSNWAPAPTEKAFESASLAGISSVPPLGLIVRTTKVWSPLPVVKVGRVMASELPEVKLPLQV